MLGVGLFLLLLLLDEFDGLHSLFSDECLDDDDEPLDGAVVTNPDPSGGGPALGIPGNAMDLMAEGKDVGNGVAPIGGGGGKGNPP